MLIAVVLLRVTDSAGMLKMPHIQKDVAKALIPLIAINVLGLGVNTLCLVYVETSFYQVPSHFVNFFFFSTGKTFRKSAHSFDSLNCLTFL